MIRDGKIFLLMTPAEAEMLAWGLHTASGTTAPRKHIKWWTELALSLQREAEAAREHSAIKIESGIPIPENRGRKRKIK